jgi:phage/plasmid-associated DNA primase
VYQIPALALIHTDVKLTPSKTCYVFLGDPNTGKSIIETGYSELFGESTISRVSLTEIVNNKFVKPMLEGRVMNLDDELPEVLQTAETREIKAITGTKFHTLEPKNQKPYNGIITAILVFAGNQMPKCIVSKDAAAFWERFDIIKFENVFPTNDAFFQQTFTEVNKSAMLNKVLDSMFTIKSDDDAGCIIKRNIPKQEIYENWQYSSSYVYKCIMEITEPCEDPIAYDKKTLYKVYNNWCDAKKIPKEDNRRAWSLDEMGRELISTCIAKVMHTGEGAGGRSWVMKRKLKPEWLLPEDKEAAEKLKQECEIVLDAFMERCDNEAQVE